MVSFLPRFEVSAGAGAAAACVAIGNAVCHVGMDGKREKRSRGRMRGEISRREWVSWGSEEIRCVSGDKALFHLDLERGPKSFRKLLFLWGKRATTTKRTARFFV